MPKFLTDQFPVECKNSLGSEVRALMNYSVLFCCNSNKVKVRHCKVSVEIYTIFKSVIEYTDPSKLVVTGNLITAISQQVAHLAIKFCQ